MASTANFSVCNLVIRGSHLAPNLLAGSVPYCSRWKPGVRFIRRSSLLLPDLRYDAVGRGFVDFGISDANVNPSTDLKVLTGKADTESSNINHFFQILEQENDPLDKEQAIVNLWQYSQGGENCIEGIMRYSGCLNLIIGLLNSDSESTCEAAAGLLRTISSVHRYRAALAEFGVILEIIQVLSRSSSALAVKEQCLCALWNLSVDENIQVTLADLGILPFLVECLDDEDLKVKEAAGGTLANLSSSSCNHSAMVEAGVIPKLAGLIKSDSEGIKSVKKLAKFVLLELCTDKYLRTLVVKEGLIRVPLIGAAAYKSFKPITHSWPSWPDGTVIECDSRPSRYGASELLLGLNVQKNLNISEGQINALLGRSRQQFLARVGAIETENLGVKEDVGSSLSNQYTLLPLIDGIARLVLILGLEDDLAISRAAASIAEAAINDQMCILFMEAGAVKPLVQLLNHEKTSIKKPVACAVEALCVSHHVRSVVEEEGILDTLVDLIKAC